MKSDYAIPTIAFIFCDLEFLPISVLMRADSTLYCVNEAELLKMNEWKSRVR